MPGGHTDLGLIVDSVLNRESLQDLLDANREGSGLIPFVGAGLSRPFGYPEWGGFLCERARTMGCEGRIEARLSRGEYEEAAQDLLEVMGPLAFNDCVRHTFGRSIPPGASEAAARALPALAAGPVLTTNFDRVLETVFQEAGRPFREIVRGAPPARIANALQSNVALLWKLHGDCMTPEDRILTNAEYAEHYGHTDPAQIDWRKPLPLLFENLLVARPVLFLGCSLAQDRTVGILAAFARRRPGVGHYALLEDPGDAPARHGRALAMSKSGIRPLWFPCGRFDLIGPFIGYLAEHQHAAGRPRVSLHESRINAGAEEHRLAVTQAAASALPGPLPQRAVGEPPDRPSTFHGRAHEMRAICEHLLAPATRAISVVGPSGFGKTALAVRLLEDLQEGRWPSGIAGRPVDGIVYLGSRTDGITVERLFASCAQMLGGPAGAELTRAWGSETLKLEDKIDRLLQALSSGLHVILLDHLDDLLDADGRVVDPELATFLARSLTRRHGARLLITSGVRPAFPREGAGAEAHVALKEGLETADAVAMVRDLLGRGSPDLAAAMDDGVLEEVAGRLHRVPRALQVFAGILSVDDSETVDGLLARFYQHPDVVRELFREGIERLDQDARMVVDALAVIGQPVPAAAVEMLLQPFAPALDDEATLRRLARAQIVRLVGRVKATGTWALHPIDQDFAYERCPPTGRYSRQTLHHRAAEWYKSVRPPRETWGSVDGLEPLLREFDHRVKAGLYDDAASVLAECNDELIRLGQAGRAVALHLQIEGRVTSERLRMRYALGLAHAYRTHGPLQKAVVWYDEALKLAREQEHHETELDSLGWTGELFRRLGRLDEGAVVVREAVEISRRLGDRARTARWLGELGLNSCYRGALGEALSAAEEAHRIALEIENVDCVALAVDCLALVHLARGDAVRAIQAARQAIASYEQGSWRHVMYVLNVQGLAHLDLSQIEEAVSCFDRAYKEAVAYDDPRVQGMARFNCAHAYRLKPDTPRAIELADEAVRIFTRTGGAELRAARGLADSLRARAAGIPAAEARCLLAVAQGAMANPDLRSPRGVLDEALALARETQQTEIAAEAERLAAAMQARLPPAGASR